jgi:hypothetical protein
MQGPAKVISTQALLDAKAALLEFAAQAHSAYISVDADVARMGDRLHRELPAKWKAECRKRHEEVEQWKQEISRKRLIAAPEPASVVFEQKKMRQAEARLDIARRKEANTRKWAMTWDKQAQQYRGACRALNDALASDIPKAVARLEAMLKSLEDYAKLVAPSVDPDGLTSPPLGDQTNAKSAEEWLSRANAASTNAPDGSIPMDAHSQAQPDKDPRP